MHASAFSLETSMPTILPCCGILPLPSLLVRALAPKQLFGLKEDTGSVPRSPAGYASGGNGLRSGDGRLLRTAVRPDTLPKIPDTRWAAVERLRLRRGHPTPPARAPGPPLSPPARR